MRTSGTLQTTPSSLTTPPPNPQFSPRAESTVRRSPVPYLFGGLAAMLGLIALALLILACSYWKLSGRMNTGEGQRGDRDVEAGDEKNGSAAVKRPLPVFEEKIVVIMAGDLKPTFLATPMSRDSSFGDGNIGKSDQIEEKEDQKPSNEITDHFDQRITENTDQQMNREVQEITQPEPGQELNQ
ncbi:protein GLUTAMINE DUMPER 3-like [Olea europaea var. sylvestris]|uniref:Glutamine dumper 3 n=1 Tax=Olea europaea subsp. europaea TaxID=158383 RepID=A0A8S0SHG3_OLEEU|nr:protein GLUTAMINE DUMPER 3-like [Olea europaea var. sylvestris]CAA2992175.1 glutamine dumper 3 [Olea europaea subsp. europaea]